MVAKIDFANRQQVEGFAQLVSQPGIQPFDGCATMGPDFRGPVAMGATRDWWRRPWPDELDLVWLTASVPAAVETTFSFIGQSSNLPENAYPSNQATLYADDTRVLTFDLGQRSVRTWQEGEWGLEFVPKTVHSTVDGYHRQLSASGCSGLYRLAAPAKALRAGQPLRLKVVLEAPRSDSLVWFAVSERSDALEVSDRTNAQEIAQLQQELIHLKRVIGGLARRQYPELFPERLPTEEVMIYTNGRAHVHVPEVLCLQNGDLLCTWREATEHLSCDGKFAMVRSRDGGKAWGEHQILREYPETDERDGCIAQLKDGTVIAHLWPNPYYSRRGRYLGHQAPDYRGRPGGIYIGWSHDNGHTWTWSDRGLVPSPWYGIYSSQGIVELPTGRLLMANYFTPEGESHCGCCLHSSDDKGHSWQLLATVADLPPLQLGEPGIVLTRSGRLIMLMRPDNSPLFYQANSDDGGVTWTPAVPTVIPGAGNPPSMVNLPDGTVLCAYCSRQDPCGVYLVASYDEGQTWDLAHRRVIRDDLPNWDMSYTSTALLPDGRVLVVYYMNMFERFFIVGNFLTWQRP